MTIDVKGIGKVTASKETLNMLAVVFIYAQEAFENRSKDVNRSEKMRAVAERMAGYQDESRQSIYDALEAVGFYNK